MAGIKSLLILVLVLMTLTQITEGRRRGRGRRHHHRSRLNDQMRRWRESLFSGHSFDLFGSDPRNPFFSFDFSWAGPRAQPWWTGPHVCESETEEFTNSTDTNQDFVRHFRTASMTCDDSGTAYICKETMQTMEGKQELIKTKQCCHGFTRKAGDFGCPQKVEMKNLLMTAEELGLSDFLRALDILRLTRAVREDNLTLFAPVNGAYGLDGNLMAPNTDIFIKDEPEGILISEPSAERAVEFLQDAILSHVIDGRVRTSAMQDEQVFPTMSGEGSTIRINYFVVPTKVTTANCIPVESSDHMATNGVIHTLKKAMRPVTKSALEYVTSSPELSTLKTVLAAANFVSVLEDLDPMTLLAPTNRAFEMMDARIRERLLRGDRKCLEKVLLNHILPHTICMSVINGESKTRNKLDKLMNLTRTDDDKVFYDDAQVISQDIMVTNGVIHLIDQVLVPEEALDVMEVLKRQGFVRLLELIDRSLLTKTVDTAENITLFAPTNEAIEKVPKAVLDRLAWNPENLAEVLLFHASPGIRESGHFYNNELVKSLEGSEIRMNKYHDVHRYGKIHTAQCARVSHRHIEACNGKIVVLEDMMFPPKGNVIDVLALDKRFSTLVSLVKRSGLADSLQEDGPFTIFAPNNQAFEDLNPELLDSLTQDKEKLVQLLKGHIFANNLCCAGIVRGTWYAEPRVTTQAGTTVKLIRKHDGDLLVGGARVLTCDLTATNGNVMELDTVLVPQRSTRHGWEHNFRDSFHEFIDAMFHP